MDEAGQKVEEGNLQKTPATGEIVRSISATNNLIDALGKGKSHKYVRFIMAAISSLPWVGALLSLSSEMEQEEVNELLKLYVEEQEPRYRDLESTLKDITERLEDMGDEVRDRIESPEYLALVRRAFRSWDNAETQEKREYIKKLITNAAIIELCPDDLIRLFIDWVDNFHEAHFAVIKEVYKHPGITRGEIWDNINNSRPNEDSAEAGLFRYLIRELNMGGVVAQQKERNDEGRAYRATPAKKRSGGGEKLTESTYEDTKPLELTALGKEFIQYVLNDVVKRIE